MENDWKIIALMEEHLEAARMYTKMAWRWLILGWGAISITWVALIIRWGTEGGGPKKLLYYALSGLLGACFLFYLMVSERRKSNWHLGKFRELQKKIEAGDCDEKRTV